jgi:hypothetical protein
MELAADPLFQREYPKCAELIKNTPQIDSDAVSLCLRSSRNMLIEFDKQITGIYQKFQEFSIEFMKSIATAFEDMVQLTLSEKTEFEDILMLISSNKTVLDKKKIAITSCYYKNVDKIWTMKTELLAKIAVPQYNAFTRYENNCIYCKNQKFLDTYGRKCLNVIKDCDEKLDAAYNAGVKNLEDLITKYDLNAKNITDKISQCIAEKS